ncbi:hypothetical protein KIN20_000209 [Parelaphostrongylus tenuis]|uniref:Uncharacterized protein n=1 Tax=Parelaphostrongylus tenuis TaxID=148309 RepID=A0AAD5LRU2_PARTN|nr:hypothetical protein KIN20_000209 [Parelaphostrongylus tenuis]
MPTGGDYDHAVKLTRSNDTNVHESHLAIDQCRSRHDSKRPLSFSSAGAEDQLGCSSVGLFVSRLCSCEIRTRDTTPLTFPCLLESMSSQHGFVDLSHRFSPYSRHFHSFYLLEISTYSPSTQVLSSRSIEWSSSFNETFDRPAYIPALLEVPSQRELHENLVE